MYAAYVAISPLKPVGQSVPSRLATIGLAISACTRMAALAELPAAQRSTIADVFFPARNLVWMLQWVGGSRVARLGGCPSE